MKQMKLQGLITAEAGRTAPAGPDVIDVLSADQHYVLEIYTRLMTHEAPAEERQTVEALCTAIEAHLAAEEQILYPAVESAPDLAHAANRNRSSHAMIRAHIQHIREQIQQNMNYEDELRYLMADVERYFEDEASSLLTESRRYLPPGVRQQLGTEMTSRWDDLRTPRTHTVSPWRRINNAYRRHPASFLLSAAGLALFTMAGIARIRRRTQDRILSGY